MSTRTPSKLGIVGIAAAALVGAGILVAAPAQAQSLVRTVVGQPRRGRHQRR